MRKRQRGTRLTFLSALDRPLAAEAQKLSCRTMEEVVAAA